MVEGQERKMRKTNKQRRINKSILRNKTYYGFSLGGNIEYPPIVMLFHVNGNSIFSRIKIMLNMKICAEILNFQVKTHPKNLDTLIDDGLRLSGSYQLFLLKLSHNITKKSLMSVSQEQKAE